MSAKDYKGNLDKGARPSTYINANKLRRRETQSETKLWALLRNRQLLGKKFRRQHAILNYVLDFYCHECKLAVELDGHHHKKRENRLYDEERTAALNLHGIRVIRFWNEEVMKDVEGVLKRIGEYLNQPGVASPPDKLR